MVWLAAVAAPSAASAAVTATATFSSTGAQQTFVVPAGVTDIRVVAVGGRGATAFLAGPPGIGALGGSVAADLPVVPGQLLYVLVGGNAVSPDSNTTGVGGFNGGGNGLRGAGGGGGASDVRTVSSARTGSLGSRLLVAAGGGGGGEYGVFNFAAAGGSGGAPGTDGETGGNVFGLIGGTGGRGASGLAGGAGGTGGAGDGGAGSNGAAGALGTGGSGGETAQTAAVGGGGGGGGGLYGGGGGGAGGCCQAAGGGGGGGSNFVTAQSGDATTSTDATGVPLVTITYAAPAAQVTPSALTFGAQPRATVSAPQPVTVTNTGDAPLVISGLTFSGAAPADFFIGSSNCYAPVAPGGSCQVLVRFAPQAVGDRSASLGIASSAPGSPATVTLTGRSNSLPQGSPGAKGDTGATGARGPAGKGLTGAKIVCRPAKVKGGKVKIKCTLKLKGASTQARVTVRISRAHRLVRRLTAHAREGRATLSTTVRPGRYRLVILLRDQTSTVRIHRHLRARG